MKGLKHIKHIVKKIIGYDANLKAAQREIRLKKKINVGSGGVLFSDDWFSCDIDLLDLTKEENWKRLFRHNKLDNIFAEHVWEHLNEADTKLANQNCYKYLKPGGTLRIAVPDGNHPDQGYIDWVKVNGNGAGADDHKILYTYKVMKARLEKAGFSVQALEYWCEKGNFNFKDWSNEGGKVIRSSRYDNRNTNGKLEYTSLIVDAIKK
jgi:predicted SAM-dependent methyltransferase